VVMPRKHWRIAAVRCDSLQRLYARDSTARGSPPPRAARVGSCASPKSRGRSSASSRRLTGHCPEGLSSLLWLDFVRAASAAEPA